MKILAFCGNEPTASMKAVMTDLKAKGNQVLPRNPDYFSTAGLDKTTNLVIVDEGHPEAKNIKTRYAALKIDTKFVTEPKKKEE